MYLLSTCFQLSFLDLFFLIEHCIVVWQALAALGLKTGGTVQQRAERLFLTKVIVNQFFPLVTSNVNVHYVCALLSKLSF